MGTFEGFSAETIDFLWELRMNNSKAWMEQNRDRYQRALKLPFDALAAALAAESASFGGRQMKCSVSRINRDIRFSKDKSPYRACRWVVLYDAALRGTDWKTHPSFFFELEPEGYTYGLGLWSAPPALLAAYRKKIESNPAALERIAKKLQKDATFRLEGEAYQRIKNETLSPLLQEWYSKKELLVAAHGGIEELLFQAELPRFLLEQWSRWKELYTFWDTLAAEH